MATVTAQYTDKEYLVLMKEKATAWAVYDSSATALGVPLMNGEYGVEQKDPIREQEFTTGDVNATYLEQDERTLAGSFRTPLFPAAAKTLLDWAGLRTSDELDSYSLDLVSPDIECVRHLGCKVESLRLEAGIRGDLVATFNIVGRYEEKQGSNTASPTMSSVNGYTFANCRFLLSLDGGSTEIEPESVESWSLELNNKLDKGPPREDRVTAAKSGSISYLMAGKPEINGSITALWDRDDYGDMARGKLQGSFRTVAAHKSGASTAVGSGGAAAGTSVSVPVTSSASFSVNEVVRFESAAGVLKCCGKVTAKADSTHITIATLEKALVEGDLVYGKSLGFYVPYIYVDGVPKRRGRSQLVRVTLNFRAFADPSQTLWTYTAEGA